MAKINKNVHINVSPLFFDNIFEPERKKLEKIKKVSFSQRAFTEFLAKSGAKINIPKMDNKFLANCKNKKKGRNTFTIF